MSNTFLVIIILSIFLLFFSFLKYKHLIVQLFIITEFISSLYVLLFIFSAITFNMPQMISFWLILIALIAAKATIIISMIILTLKKVNYKILF